ncbi:MAG: hypothetical protein ABIQ93_01015 [Saprospiraceae bacterium]
MQNTILDHEFKETRFEVYDRFQSVEDAQYLVALLQENAVPHQVEQPSRIVDSVFTGEGFVPKVFVRVHFSDFKKINWLIEQDTLRLIREHKIDLAGHFLAEFSNQELIEVVNKPDEWNFDTATIARYLLQTRGVQYSEKQIAEKKEERLAEVRKPRSGSRIRIIALFVIGFLGAYFWGFLFLLLALPMGLYYWRDLSVDLNGGRFYTFDQPTRNLGMAIFFFTLAVFLLRLVVIFIDK